MMNRLWTIICLCIVTLNTLAQEGETNELFYNPTRLINTTNYNGKTKVNQPLSYSGLWRPYFFEMDTLSLPFRDDFSRNSLTSFDTSTYSPGFKRNEIVYSFTVNGTIVDSLPCKLTKTYSYFFNPSTKAVDSTLSTPDTVDFYLNFNNPFKKSSTKLVYPPTIKYLYDTLGNIISQDTIAKDTTYYLIKDTIRVINLAGGYGLWTDHHVYLNDNYPINPPTITVATFDGLDSTGVPYDFSRANTYGVADYLTSKPIDLESNISKTDTTVYLSFFYQAQGMGNAPEEDDSLVVEAYSPLVGFWRHLWSIKGSESANTDGFKQVMIPIRDSLFFTKGFRFRFKNYATLSGDFDHWHIDYVRLDRNRSRTDTVIFDLAITEIERTFINGFYVMPYKYFKSSPDAYLKTNIACKIRNLSPLSPTTPSLALNIFHNGSLAYNKNFGVVPFTPGQLRSIALPRDNYTFTSSMPEHWSDFKVLYNFSSTIAPTIDLRSNDTIHYNQAFRNYFQRDDGSAEAAYFIDGPGSVAVKFYVPRTDTIQAVDLLFLPLTPNGTNALFKVRIWEDSAGAPGKVLYESPNFINPFVTPRNFPSLFKLEQLITVNGYFHVGWYQEGNERLTIGFDKNTNHNIYTTYNVGDGWYTSSISGTPLVRPWLGSDPAVGLLKNSIAKNYFIFPNPTRNHINVGLNSDYNYYIFNSIGQQVMSGKGSPLSSINLTSLPEGIYYIKVFTENESFSCPIIKE